LGFLEDFLNVCPILTGRMQVLCALTPARPRQAARDCPDPDAPAVAPSNSLAPAAMQPEHPGSLGVAIMWGVALEED